MTSGRSTIVAGALAAFVVVPLLFGRPPSPGSGPNPPADATRVDINGEPLPPGAISRAGAVRFRHPGEIGQIAFAPGGRAIYAACPAWGLGQAKEFARAWSVPDGREIRRFGGEANVSAVAVSPDGKVVATGEGHDLIRIWDAATEKEIRKISAELPKEKPANGEIDLRSVLDLKFGPNGKMIVARYYQQNAVIAWDVTTGKEIHRWSNETEAGVNLSGDGKRLAIHSAGEIRIVNPMTDQLEQTITLSSDPNLAQVIAVALSPDGKTLVTTGADSAVRFWDVATAKELHRLTVRSYAWAPAFSPDGSMLAIVDYHSGDMEAVALVDPSNGKELRRLNGSTRGTRALAFSPDGKTLATGSGHALRLWDPATGNEIPPSVPGHPGAITTVSVSRDGKLLATCSDHDRVIRLWDTSNGREVRRFEGHSAGVDEVTISPNGKLLASAAQDHVFVWDLATGRLLHRIEDHAAVGAYLRFADDSKTLATGSTANTVAIWDCSSGKIVRELAAPPRGLAALLTFDDGHLLGYDEKPLNERDEDDTAILLWDVAANRAVRQFTGHSARVNGVILSADGRMLASRSMDKTIRVWEVASGAERCRFQEPGEIKDTAGWTGTQFLAFSPNGRMLVSAATDDPLVRRWDLTTEKELPPLAGHLGWIGAVEFSANGQVLVTGSQDTTVLVWDGLALGTKVPPTSRLTETEMAGYWDDLADRDARKAYRAVLALAGAGDLAAKSLGGRLRSAPAVDPKKILAWIDELDHTQFAVRERATASLIQVAGQAEDALRVARKQTQSAEVRQRVSRILEANSDVNVSPDRLREVRAIEALEGMTTPAARDALATLAKGAPGTILTREARAALNRLDAASHSAPR